MRFALGLNLVIVAAQIVAGMVASSVGLLADAAHNLADVAAVALSLGAVRLARRRPSAARSFGYHRSTILAAQANAAAVLVVAGLVLAESMRRLLDVHPVEGGLVAVAATVAAVVNTIAALALREHHGPGHEHGHGPSHPGDLNMRSAMLHLAGDALASVGVAVAGVIIFLHDGWYWLDPLASATIAGFIAWRGIALLRETSEVLLEATPAGLDVVALAGAMVAVPGVESVHDLHAWALSSEVRALSAHLVLEGHPTLEEAQVVGERVKTSIAGPFRIDHATLELECEACGEPEVWCAIDATPLPGHRHDHPH